MVLIKMKNKTRMKLKNIIISTAVALSAAALQSCDYFLPGNFELIDYVDYSSDYSGDKLVLNGRITDLHGVYAEVTHTVRPEHKEVSDTVADATVYLIEDGETIAELHKNPERKLTINYAERFMFYLLPGEVEIKEGHKYGMRLESKTRGTVESEQSTMPSHVTVDSVWVESSASWRLISFGIKYHDADDEATLCPFMRNYRKQSCHTYCTPYYNILQKSTNGKGTAEVSNNAYNHFSDSISVEMLTLSPDLASYINSLSAYDESSEDEAYEFPLPVDGNINGGYGFVGAYSVSAMTLIPDEEFTTPDENDESDMTYDRWDDEITIDQYMFFDMWWWWNL